MSERNAIHLRSKETDATVLPRAGGLVSRFTVQGYEIISPVQYLETPTSLRRIGGIQMLFPNAGQASKEPDSSGLPPNGFIKDKVLIQNITHPYQTKLSFFPDYMGNKAMYPYNFLLTVVISVGPGVINYFMSVVNFSSVNMPSAPGFHISFPIPEERMKELVSNIPGHIPTQFNWNELTVFPKMGNVVLEIPETEKGSRKMSFGDYRQITISTSRNLRKVALGSEEKTNSFFVEPRCGGDGALTNPVEQILIPPLGRVDFSLGIRDDSFTL